MPANEQPLPVKQVTVTTYSEMLKYRDLFIKEDGLNFLLVVGKHGIGKSRMFAETDGVDTAFISGHRTPLSLYASLFKNRNSNFVLDDVLGMSRNATIVGMLLELCIDKPLKKVSFGSTSKALEKRGLPEEFQTQSRVCILSNDFRSVNKYLAAVIDRAIVLDFRPSIQEIHTHVATWFPMTKHKDIYQLIEQNLSLIADPTMRDYSQAIELKEKGSDWANYLYKLWNNDPKLSAVCIIDAELARGKHHDDGKPSEEMILARFEELSGGYKRDSYFKAKKELKYLRGEMPTPTRTKTSAEANPLIAAMKELGKPTEAPTKPPGARRSGRNTSGAEAVDMFNQNATEYTSASGQTESPSSTS